MKQIADAPWIRETEATGYCSSGWWNEHPKWRDLPYDEDYDGGDGDDVYYGNESEDF